MKKLQNIIDSFQYHTQSVEDVLYKPWLKTALVSHIERDTGAPKRYIQKVVNVIYESEDI